MTTKLSIVSTEAKKFFLMEKSDSRFGDSYKAESIINSITKSQVSKFNGRKCQVIVLEDGRVFEVFSDWSARLTESFV